MNYLIANPSPGTNIAGKKPNTNLDIKHDLTDRAPQSISEKGNNIISGKTRCKNVLLVFSTFQLGEAEDLQNLIDISKFHGLQGNTSQKCQKYIPVHE